MNLYLLQPPVRGPTKCWIRLICAVMANPSSPLVLLHALRATVAIRIFFGIAVLRCGRRLTLEIHGCIGGDMVDHTLDIPWQVVEGGTHPHDVLPYTSEDIGGLLAQRLVAQRI